MRDLKSHEVRRALRPSIPTDADRSVTSRRVPDASRTSPGVRWHVVTTVILAAYVSSRSWSVKAHDPHPVLRPPAARLDVVLAHEIELAVVRRPGTPIAQPARCAPCRRRAPPSA